MEIRVIDFDKLTRSYTNYRTGINKIDVEKKSFLERLDPIKKEMESIINSAKSGLVLDQSTQREKEVKFAELQQEAMSIDGEFKNRMRELHDSLNKETFDSLQEIITEWSQNNNIDLVTGKMEVVFSKDKYDSTDDIINILKEKDLFYNETEETSDIEETQTV
jgi:Skp family chaperone for outer membrane proteins